MKRTLDVALAAVGLLVVSPFITVAAIAVKLDSPGPALYGGPRIGRAGRPFRMLKLRTMVVGGDAAGALTTGRDWRITRVGRLLRRTKIDELPQLVNVLRGEMSLVGPRPEHPDFVRLYTAEQRRVLGVRPGITGAAALEYPDEEAILDRADADHFYVAELMPRKLELELRYLATRSLATDLGLLLKTFARVIRPG